MTDRDSPHPLRPLLRNWLWEHGRIGTRWLRCADGALGFDEGKRPSFADGASIHVPLAGDGPAADTVPPPHEAGLARFLAAAQLGRPADAGSAAEVARAVADCVDIGVCCAYQADARRSRERWAQEAMFDDEIAAAVAADVRGPFAPLRAQLALYDWTVFHGLPGPLLTCDAPLVDWRVRAKPPVPFVSMPLGPHALLVGTPSKRTSRTAPVAWQQAIAMGPFKDHNRHVVDGARAWIVAGSDAELLALQPRFAPPPPPPPAALA